MFEVVGDTYLFLSKKRRKRVRVSHRKQASQRQREPAAAAAAAQFRVSAVTAGATATATTSIHRGHSSSHSCNWIHGTKLQQQQQLLEQQQQLLEQQQQLLEDSYHSKQQLRAARTRQAQPQQKTQETFSSTQARSDAPCARSWDHGQKSAALAQVSWLFWS